MLVHIHAHFIFHIYHQSLPNGRDGLTLVTANTVPGIAPGNLWPIVKNSCINITQEFILLSHTWTTNRLNNHMVNRSRLCSLTQN